MYHKICSVGMQPNPQTSGGRRDNPPRPGRPRTAGRVNQKRSRKKTGTVRKRPTRAAGPAICIAQSAGLGSGRPHSTTFPSGEGPTARDGAVAWGLQPNRGEFVQRSPRPMAWARQMVEPSALTRSEKGTGRIKTGQAHSGNARRGPQAGDQKGTGTYRERPMRAVGPAICIAQPAGLGSGRPHSTTFPSGEGPTARDGAVACGAFSPTVAKSCNVHPGRWPGLGKRPSLRP